MIHLNSDEIHKLVFQDGISDADLVDESVINLNVSEEFELIIRNELGKEVSNEQNSYDQLEEGENEED